MRDVEVRPDVGLEELLDHEIPCGGNFEQPTCGKAALLRLHPHCEGPPHHTDFKCITCWKVLYIAHSQQLSQCGSLICVRCKREFHSVEAFSDYRPF